MESVLAFWSLCLSMMGWANARLGLASARNGPGAREGWGWHWQGMGLAPTRGGAGSHEEWAWHPRGVPLHLLIECLRIARKELHQVDEEEERRNRPDQC